MNSAPLSHPSPHINPQINNNTARNQALTQTPRDLRDGSGFDPLLHNPPKYDLHGRQKNSYIIPGSDPRNILKDAHLIKNPWEYNSKEPSFRVGGNRVSSKTELIEKRRLDKIPDKSYDLDGDGFVGGRDYVISKRFDVDKDGKLNTNEKRQAMEAIKNNVESEYVWNLENQGVGKPCRTLQKRGKILELENFLPVSDSYPQHPIHEFQPESGTLTELKEKRRQDTKKFVEEKTILWEKHNPTQVIVESVKTNSNSIKPKFTSMKQIKNEKERLARDKLGLTDKTDIKVTDKDPSLAYVNDPEIRTKGDLRERLRQENYELSKKILSRKHMDEIERLKFREDEIFDMCYYGGEGKTYKKLKEERKQEMCDYNLKVFSNQTIGVHGHELPKFADSEEYREYWKFKDGWTANPEVQSQTELLENQKYWKKREDIKIKDYLEEEPLIDEFKKVHVPISKKDGVMEKVSNMNIYKNFDPDNPEPIDIENVKRNHIYKWTTLVNQFSSQKFKNGRYFDNLPSANDNTIDDKAMYSSFAEDGLFKAVGKDQTNKKKVEFKNQGKDKDSEAGAGGSLMKDNLFTKFSTKEPTVPIKEKPKNMMIRTKGF